MSTTRTLAALSRCDADHLARLYREARVPASLRALDGSPRCRVLRPVGPLGRGPAGALFRWLASSPRFPWAGKRFAARRPREGSGINRLRLAGERQWFPFDSRLDVSASDGRPCVTLDYDRPDNPEPLRRICDELRETAPGLFIGQALVRTEHGPRPLLFFACDYTDSTS